MKRIKLSYEGKEIKSGDVIVIRLTEVISAYQAKDLYEATKQAFPDHQVVILPPKSYLETYDKESYKKFLDSQYKMLEGRQTE